MLWEAIVNSFGQKPRDVQTIPFKGSGLWFYVSGQDDKVHISKARNHTDSSQIQGIRLLDKHNCEVMFDLYQRRKRGEHVSSEAKAITRNQVYWYGIFHEMKL